MPGTITRTVNGETRVWVDGHGWVPIPQEPAQAPTQGLFTGGLSRLLEHPIDTLTDLWNGATQHPADTLKGFLTGSAEGLPTAATIAQTTLLPALTGGVSIPAQMLAGGGGQMLSDAANLVAGTPEAPKSAGQFFGRAAEGAAIPGVIGAAGKTIGALGKVGPAVDTALEMGSHVPGLKTVSRMGKALRGLGGAAKEELPAWADRYLPNVSAGERASAPVAAAAEELPKAPIAEVDRYMPNVSGDWSPEAIDARQSARLGGIADSGKAANGSLPTLDDLLSPQPAPDVELPESWKAFVSTPPTEALTRLDRAMNGLRDMPSYTDWSNGMDEIINQAAAEGLPESHWRSWRPTKALLEKYPNTYPK